MFTENCLEILVTKKLLPDQVEARWQYVYLLILCLQKLQIQKLSIKKIKQLLIRLQTSILFDKEKEYGTDFLLSILV